MPPWKVSLGCDSWSVAVRQWQAGGVLIAGPEPHPLYSRITLNDWSMQVAKLCASGPKWPFAPSHNSFSWLRNWIGSLQWEGDAGGRPMNRHGKNESATARSVWDIRLMFSPRNQTTNNAVRAAASVTDAADAPARVQNKVGETLAHGTSQRWHGSPFWPLY